MQVSHSVALLSLLGAGLSAQPLRSLKSVATPEPPELAAYVRDRASLVALGKAFFWDMQAGSDGVTACATCHFHAGADHRPQNQLTDAGRPFPVNFLLDPVIFPFRWFADPSNRGSEILRDSSMRVGSAGTFRRAFKDIVPGQAAEIGEDLADTPEYISGGLHVRRVTARNTPTVVNSVFHVRNFWDGRAQRIFNGFTPSGNAADAPGVLASRNGVIERQQVRLDNSSLASQAVGPVLDALEMSYAGRTWPKLGKKMLSLRPLALQRVAADDSVLGGMARAAGRGLDDRFSYLNLIQAAFEPAFWESNQLFDGEGKPLGRSGAAANTSEFTQAEYNFSLFWGLALQAYQATLVSNDAPFDRFMEGNAAALTAEEQEGMRFFQFNGRCTTCHGGAEFTAASFSAQGPRGNGRAFQRTGVRPVEEDRGSGNGSFKTSGLRNLEFSGPYFHNGGQSTLEQVVEFYSRGGDVAPNIGIRPFLISATQSAALVAFMKALSDDRVRYERAPFDHPELCVPVGHQEARPGVLMPGASRAFPASAAERWAALPATGAGGNPVPLQTFDEMIRGVDQGRAHSLTEACSIALPE